MTNTSNTVSINSINSITSNVINFPITSTKSKSNDTTPPKYTNQRGLLPVMPLKDINDITRAKEYLLTKPERYIGQNIRDYTIFALNINMGLRSGDLRHLHISDITDYNFETIVIKEQKTRNSKKETRVITLPVQIQNLIKEYLKSLNEYHTDDYLFSSRSVNRKNIVYDENYPNATNQPMSGQQLNNILAEMKEVLNLKYRVTSHMMRKTFAYQKLMAHKNDPMYLSTIQKVLGHSSPKVTLHYVGIEAEEIANVYENDVL